MDILSELNVTEDTPDILSEDLHSELEAMQDILDGFMQLEGAHQLESPISSFSSSVASPVDLDSVPDFAEGKFQSIVLPAIPNS